MKFTCSTKDLAGAVNAASKIVNGHTTVPILSNVLVVADGSEIRVRATDLELTLEQRLDGAISESGSVTVPAKLFSGYLGNLPAGEVEVSGGSTRTSVKAQRSNYDFHALPAEEYPPLPAAQAGMHIRMPAGKLREGVQAAIFAASNEEARGAVLMGTLVEIEGDSLTLVATDGYRLAKWQTRLEAGIEGSAKFVVPSRALGEAARNMSGTDTVELTVHGSAGNQLAIVSGGTAIYVRLVDGSYPNYQQVIPQQFDRSITVNVSALIGALKRAELVAGDRASMVKLAFADQRLAVTANSEATGNAYEELEIEQTGEDLTIAFNARYLIEVLNHLDSSHAVLEFLGPLSPVAIRPLSPGEGVTQLYVLMPLRQ